MADLSSAISRHGPLDAPSRRAFLAYFGSMPALWPFHGINLGALTMTDAELRDAAVAELKQTTVGWLKTNGTPRYPSGTAPDTTHWGNAMKLLAQIGQQAPPPPPPTGIPLVSLVDLNFVFTPAYIDPPAYGGAGGGGIFAQNTPYGAGWKFIATELMPAIWDQADGTKTKVCLAQGHPDKFWGQLGKTEHWEFQMFIKTQALPDVTHWHAGELWQWHTGSASGHHISLDPNSGGRYRIGRLSSKTGYEFVYVPIIFDRWVKVTYDIHWSNAADGFIKVTLDGKTYIDFHGATDFDDGARRHQFGWYADRVLTNEILFGGITVQRT